MQFEIPLETALTGIVVTGVTTAGLTENSEFSPNLYAYGAASNLLRRPPPSPSSRLSPNPHSNI